MSAVRSCGLASRGMKAGAVAAGSGFVFVDIVCVSWEYLFYIPRYRWAGIGVDAEKQDVEYRNIGKIVNVSGEIGNG